MNILIVGAGPTGLTAAIELARQGIIPRIIDRKPAPSPLSRAVGIHANSLALLEQSGVTGRLLAEGLKISQGEFHLDRTRTITLNFGYLEHRYNFMLALPQNRTEEIMIARLKELGGNVEYSTSLKSLELVHGKPRAEIGNAQSVQPADFDIVIGADGIHSIVRQSIGIDMQGYDYPNLWSISDFDCPDLPWTKNAVHFFLHDHGEIGFVVCIGTDHYRAISNTEHALKSVPGNYTISHVHNENTFKISVRQAATYQKGPVFIAGDAANVHSPAGARGMNVGIEDACALARMIIGGDTENYTAERYPIGRATIKLSETAARSAQSTNPVFKIFRNLLMIALSRSPSIQRILLKKIAGLDEPMAKSLNKAL